jgi:hypothetical protein
MAVSKDQTKKFEGASEEVALAQANRWVADLSKHGPLHVASIVTGPKWAKWVATVTYQLD